MSWQRIGTVWGGALLLAAFVACGSEPPPEPPATTSEWNAAEERSEAANRAPVITSLRISPEEPIARDRVRAFATVNEPDGETVTLGYTWRIDGRPITESGAEINIGPVARDTEISVVVTASDGRAESKPVEASIRVRNQRPVITNLVLTPAVVVARGRPVVARAEARDGDGDPLEFTYEWNVNGNPSGEDSPTLQTHRLKKGDRIQVRVWVSDGRDESEGIYSGAVAIDNGVPEIVSAPTGLGPDGVFRYAVEAKDPDGDRNLRYKLREGPPGMMMDPISGVLTWKPSVADAGVHPVEILVVDSEGGSVNQTFELTVASQAPAAPAP